MPHLIRLARPEWSPHIYLWDAKNEEPVRLMSDPVVAGVSVVSATEASAATVKDSKTVLPIAVFIVDSCSPPITTKQLSKIIGGQDEITAVFVHHNASWESAIQKLAVSRKHVYRSFDVAAAKAAVNFQFWTGQTPEFASIRDSLDEYCQW
jgi:hypothetical protein